MYKVGMYGGSFNPPHLGHVNNIMEASCLCEKLYVVLGFSKKRDKIDHRERFKWLKQIVKDLPNTHVLELEDSDISKETYNWEKGRDDIVAKIEEEIDIVFCGDDYKGTNLFESLYPSAKVHYFSRDIVNISSTEIRDNPYKYYEYLPKVVRPYYTKKVVIMGTESCGKSTLVNSLAKIYNTTFVEELGREVCEQAGGIDNMIPSDFPEIMFLHKVRELEALKDANKVLFIDTEAIITMYYLRLLFDNTKENIEPIIALGNAVSATNQDYHYIFLEPDVAWVQDGTRTYGEDEVRNSNNIMLKEMLAERNIKYETVNGNYHERLVKVKKIVDRLISL